MLEIFDVDCEGEKLFAENYELIAAYDQLPFFLDVTTKIYEEYNLYLRQKTEFFEGIPILQKEFIDFDSTQIKVFHFLLSNLIHFQSHGIHYYVPQVRVW